MGLKKMDIQDWKKIKREKTTGWTKKLGSFWQGIYIDHDKDWKVEIIDFNNDKVNSSVLLYTSFFTTKLQALKKVKAYMKLY